MITKYSHNNLTWIDIESPTGDDIASIVQEFSVHPTWAQELLEPSARAKTDSTEHTFYAALHYPDHPSRTRDGNEIEVDYIIGEHFLITAHYGPIDIFTYLQKQFEAASTLGTVEAHNGPELFLILNNELYRGLREELEPIRKEIKDIESNIFKGREFHMVRELSDLQRRLLDFKQSIRPHKIILKSLHLQASHLFPKYSINEDNIFRDYSRVENALENARELLKELRDTNDSLLTAKNNDVTKRLTLMAFVTFPLTLVATVLLAAESPAIFHGEHGFFIVVGVLIAMYLVMHIYFAYKKWI